MDAVCLLCSVLSCAPGYFSSGCAAGSVSDAMCLPCSDGPWTGPFNWTDGCNFACADGYWRNGSDACVECSPPECVPGSYPSACGGSNDTQCLACDAPAVSPINWTRGCEYECASGYFLFNGTECALCSDPLCFPGFVRTRCTAHVDATCNPCAQEPGGLFVWISECDYACLGGYYQSDNSCKQCSAPFCAPGTYPVPCSATADSACAACPLPPTDGIVWAQGCDYVCEPGRFWRNGSECVACSMDLVCDPGWVPSTCTQTSDSACTPCTPVDNSAWADGCRFVCDDGFYLLLHGQQCLPCSAPRCAPGQFAIECTNVSDSVCAGCDMPSAPTTFGWTQGCGYECLDGYYLFENSTCHPCTPSLICPPGLQPSDCTRTRDAHCIPCAEQPAGYVWTSGCDFSCVDGYFLNESNVCSPCSAQPCAAGTYAVGCTAYADSFCAECVPPAGGFAWTAGCGFECADGYYRDGPHMCTECTKMLGCPPGRFLSNCTSTADAVCTACPNAQAHAAWTSGCEFRCLNGYYGSGGSCVACLASRKCDPGTFLVACSATADSACAPCQTSAEEVGFVWTDACSFRCVDGYYLSSRNNSCVACASTMPVCDLGFFGVNCSAASDAHCAPCASVGEGALWVDGCDFVCVGGYEMVGRSCRRLPQTTPPPVVGPPPAVYTVVHTAMTMQNTVDEVCVNLASLLLALSEALAILSKGATKFTTNITSLAGRTCVANVCPQCGNVSLDALVAAAAGGNTSAAAPNGTEAVYQSAAGGMMVGMTTVVVAADQGNESDVSTTTASDGWVANATAVGGGGGSEAVAASGTESAAVVGVFGTTIIDYGTNISDDAIVNGTSAALEEGRNSSSGYGLTSADSENVSLMMSTGNIYVYNRTFDGNGTSSSFVVEDGEMTNISSVRVETGEAATSLVDGSVSNDSTKNFTSSMDSTSVLQVGVSTYLYHYETIGIVNVSGVLAEIGSQQMNSSGSDGQTNVSSQTSIIIESFANSSNSSLGIEYDSDNQTVDWLRNYSNVVGRRLLSSGTTMTVASQSVTPVQTMAPVLVTPSVAQLKGALAQALAASPTTTASVLMVGSVASSVSAVAVQVNQPSVVGTASDVESGMDVFRQYVWFIAPLLGVVLLVLILFCAAMIKRMYDRQHERLAVEAAGEVFFKKILDTTAVRLKSDYAYVRRRSRSREKCQADRLL